MNLVGLMPVRNEDWVLGLSARVALMWCDQLVLAIHQSSDGSRDIMHKLGNEFPGRISVREDYGWEWREMSQRQMMLVETRELGATHVAIIDADEILTANLLTGIRERVAALNYGEMLSLPGYNLRGGMHRYHLNGVWGQRWFSTAFKDVNTAAWKGDKFHSREPSGVPWKTVQPVKQGDGGTLHLWGANERRLIAKHALYKVVERVRWPDKPVADIDQMYSWAVHGDTTPARAHFGTPATWTYANVPAQWIAPYADLIHDHLHLNQVPWQEAEVRRLVTEHGAEKFAGLDLFGLA